MPAWASPIPAGPKSQNAKLLSVFGRSKPLADWGNSLLPQDAAAGNPGNHWRFSAFTSVGCLESAIVGGALGSFFLGQ